MAMMALSVGFVSCGGDDDKTEGISEVWESYFMFETSDGSVYKFHTNYVTRTVDGKELGYLEYEFPKDVTVDTGYGETTTYNYEIQFVGELGNYIIVNLYTRAEGVPGILYLIHKDLSTYETKDILGGGAYSLGTSLLYVQSFTTIEYEIYDTSITKILSGKIKNEGVTMFSKNPDLKVAGGEYNGIYYVLTAVDFYRFKPTIVNLNTGVATPLDVEDVDDIAEFFPNEPNKPKVKSYTYSFNKDHFEVIINFVYYSGDKGTVIRKFGLDGAEIGYEIS